MRRVIGSMLVLALAVTIAACGDDGGGSAADPASAGSCEELADIGIDMVQAVIDELGSMSMQDFLEAASGDEPPAAITRMEEQSDALEARAAELGCSETDAQTLLCERADRLHADTEVGTLLLQSILSGCG
jgi:hypothetical protein